jgi:TRAP-type mannitol/chloroaromatic compound transport system permease small subunit
MPITGWYPPAGPLRTIVLLGLALFALQGFAQFIRDLYLLIRGKPYD